MIPGPLLTSFGDTFFLFLLFSSQQHPLMPLACTGPIVQCPLSWAPYSLVGLICEFHCLSFLCVLSFFVLYKVLQDCISFGKHSTHTLTTSIGFASIYVFNRIFFLWHPVFVLLHLPVITTVMFFDGYVCAFSALQKNKSLQLKKKRM